MVTESFFDCPSCDREFDSEHGMKVHHTASHGESLAKKSCVCEVCDTEFNEFESRIATGRGRFCSRECKHKSGREEITCEQCGQRVLRPRHRVDRSENQYCSRECNWEYLRENKEAAPGWEGGAKVTRPCDTCGGTVTRDRSHFYGTVYCSNQCMSEGRKGERHHNWVPGTVTWYGENWFEQREKALERDNRQCVSCGISREEHRELHSRDLSVHHIDPIRNYRDGDELNFEAANELSNLITVCMPCHRKMELKKDESREVVA